MVKVQEIKIDPSSNEAVVSLFADTKAEMEAPDVQIIGLGDYDIAMGSTCLTASAEVAFYTSEGSWNWVG